MGRAPCCEKEEGLLKKGAWTAEEDEKLVSFIRRNNGHGSWRTLPQLAGLQRCGKSCRLRWTNYLRPNIKRGGFTADEEWTITQLHALLGNKWSSIAARLPGRTDNEVKNHWNTHLKKRLSRIGIDPVTHRPASRSDVVNFNNSNAFKADNLMKHRRHLYNNSSSFNCTNPQSHKRELPRVSVVDQSYVSHMAQWELARLEAEGRQMRGKASAAPSISEPASSGGVNIRQAWTHTDKGQAGKEDELWEVMLGELLEVPHELGTGPPPPTAPASGPVSMAHDMTSHSSSSAGSHEFLKEVDITSDLTCLIHQLSPDQAASLSSSPGPYFPHDPLLALVPASPGLLPPCEPVYLANMHSLIGAVISSCPC